MINFTIQILFLLNQNSAQYEWERNDKESMICLTSKPSQSFFVYHIEKQRKIFLKKKGF